MYRNERLVIRLSNREAEAVSRLAEAERLPASTLARRLLLLEAERNATQRPEAARRGLTLEAAREGGEQSCAMNESLSELLGETELDTLTRCATRRRR